MGAVQVDIHKNERPFRRLSFSDVDAIEGLIVHRSNLDEFYNIKQDGLSASFGFAGDVTHMNEEIIVTYITLDDYIGKVIGNKFELDVISMYQDGYSSKEIAICLKISKKEVENILKNIVTRIKVLNDSLYFDSIKTLSELDKRKGEEKISK